MDILGILGLSAAPNQNPAAQAEVEENERRKKLLQNPDMDSSGIPQTAIQAMFGTPSAKIGGL